MAKRYHDLKPAEIIRYPSHISSLLTGKQADAILDAITDIRLLEAATFREQCFILTTLLHDVDSPNEENSIISYDLIGEIFDPPRQHGSIIQQAKKFKEDVKAPHRPYILDDAEVELVKQLIYNSGDDYLTIEDISIYISLNMNKYPSRSTIKRIIKERIQGFKIAQVKPIDEDRHDVTYESIKEYYRILEEEARGVPVGFIFNLDESGQNQYVDAPYIFVVVPEDEEITTYPVSRATKRITLMHCISTDGTSCDPMIIVPRLTIDNEVYDEITSGSVLFRSQSKGYCTHELFSDWMKLKFLPYLAAKRKDYNYRGKAIIIMDGFKGHEKSLDTLEHMLTEFNVQIIMIPPHSSDQVQPLDLFGFNIQKNRTNKFIVQPHYTWQTNQILAIIEGLNTIRSPHFIRTAWEMSGIYRERNIPNETAEQPFIQYHIINMDLNNHIRSSRQTRRRHGEKEDTIGSLNRRKKYKTLPPNERFKKRKEIKLKRPEDVAMQKVTKEEAVEYKKKLNDIAKSQKLYNNDNDNTSILDYFTLVPKKKNKTAKATKSLPRVARINLPNQIPDFDDFLS